MVLRNHEHNLSTPSNLDERSESDKTANTHFSFAWYNRDKMTALKIIGVSLLILLVVGAGVAAGLATGYMSGLPKLSAYKDLGHDQTSKVYATDGSVIATFHAEQNREIIPLNQIPKNLQNAVIDTEDERFYKHHGVDLKAIIRALYANFRSREVSEGASTITQQYVRNSLITPEVTVSRKVKEAALAYQLEQKYSKDKILEMYLNTIYFGQGCYGVETAAENFFHKKAKDLTLGESSLLAGLVGAPNLFSPYTNPELAGKRRVEVLDRLLKNHHITKKEREAALKEPIAVFPINLSETPTVAPYFVEHVKLTLIDKYGANMVYRGGLRIYTTIDLRLQSIAEDAVWGTLNEPGDPSGALASIDPKTGYIKALVGGRDFNANKFNLATQSKRCPGSSFKTVALVAALENNIPPTRSYDASSPRYIKLADETWRVENYEGGHYSGSMSLTEATVWSVNVVYAQLAMDVGAGKIAETAQKMGVTSNVPPYPAIAIGGLPDGVSPLEMASVYATLANDGVFMKPTAITKVTDAQGNLIEQAKLEGKQVINKNVARTANGILKQVIQRGTGFRADIGRPACGKTGTAEYKQDAWFVGHTPDLATAVWMGFPEGSVTMDYYHGYPPYGGSLPAIMWKSFMSRALEGVPVSDFPGVEQSPTQSGTEVMVTVCTESGLLATSNCPSTKDKWFTAGQEPKEYCNIHTQPPQQAPPDQTGYITVAGVEGQSIGSATSVLTGQGLTVVFSKEKSDTVPVDHVISQSPGGGTSVPPNSTVSLVISDGPP